VIDDSNTITLAGNHFGGNGGDTAQSSQVYFAHTHGTTTDNVTLSADVYKVQTVAIGADVTPSYVYDADANASLTNVHLYETATRPAVSVFSSNAQPILVSQLVPQLTQNLISGLSLFNDSSSDTVDIAPGSAADSTNSIIMQIPAGGCKVDLNNSGAMGLDLGGGIQYPKTYFIYVIAAVGGSPTTTAPTPSCIASESPLLPQFTASGFTSPSSGYVLNATGGFFSTGATVFNVSNLAGATIGDVITSPNLPTPPPYVTIQSFSSNNQVTPTGDLSTTTSPDTINNVSSLTGVRLGKAIQDVTNKKCIPNNTYVTNTGTTPPLNITMSQSAECTSTGDTLSISGAEQIVMSANATTTDVSLLNLKISTGYYRLIGAVYTISVLGVPNVVPFQQDGDTFYLKSPTTDIGGGTGTGSAQCKNGMITSVQICPLSVPIGIPVEAFGRVVSSGQSFLSSTDAPQTASAFATAPPGYTTTHSTTANNAYPFHLFTSTAGKVNAEGGSSNQMYEVTDGWIWHRAP